MIRSERFSHKGDDEVSENNGGLSEADGEPMDAANALPATTKPYSNLTEPSEAGSEMKDIQEEDGDELDDQQVESETPQEDDGGGCDRVFEQVDDLNNLDGDGNFVAHWIQENFPDIASEADLQSLATKSELGTGNMTDKITTDLTTPFSDVGHELLRCEECSSRAGVLVCEDCDLTLCFRCTDAIHIIPALSRHSIQFSRSCSSREVSSRQFDIRFKAQTPVSTKEVPIAKNPVTKTREEFPPKVSTTQMEESRLALPTGTSIFFRAPDCARWPRELLHGTLVSLAPATTSSEDTFYHRVLWLRGVEALPNSFFRASLVLPGWDLSSGGGDSFGECYGPHEIGVFPTQLAALRAVITAEQIARAKFRRELAGGRMRIWNRFNDDELGLEDENAGEEVFPSSEILEEVVAETADALGLDFAVRLTRQDDAQFYEELSRGTWSFRRWMESIHRGDNLSEEDAVPYEDATVRRTAMTQSNDIDDEINAAVPTPWPSATRIRFFRLPQHDLVYPERVCQHHLRAILEQLLFVYAGFAWRLWRDYVTRHREREELQHRERAAYVLQGWARRMDERRRQKARQMHLAGGEAGLMCSSVDVLELYRRRQVEARKLYMFLTRQVEERKRNALQLWRAAVGPNNPPPSPSITWHPSHGMKAMLPKLPRMGARRRTPQDNAAAPVNQLVIEDMATFKLFRANHAGPVDTSYWIIRARVLAGVCPVGPSFREARRLVSRTDFATSVLLQQISVFVCLMEPQELRSMETTGEKTPGSGTEWSYVRQVRAKYQALCIELKGAETVSKRHVELARQALTDFDVDAANAASAAMGGSGTRNNKKRRASMTLQLQQEEDALEEARMKQIREALEQKLQLAEQQAVKAASEVTRLAMMQLEFLYFPIAHDGVPDSEQALIKFLGEQVESKLRAGKNLYVFSRLGHGRTGLVAALLLGRVYGITSAEALDRAQRTHDCQRPGAPRGLSFCSPTTAPQMAFVRRALALSIDPIYVPLVLENSSVEFRSVRNQQRGLLAESYLRSEGFMISANGDDQVRGHERLEQKRLQRIARRESTAAALQRERRTQQHERGLMEIEECHEVAFAAMTSICEKIADEI